MNRRQRRQEMRSVRQTLRRAESSSLRPVIIDLFQRALIDHQARRLPQAEAAYRQILAMDPAHTDAYYNLGIALDGLGRPAEAEVNYREALRLRPNFPEAHTNLGNALFALGRPA